MPEQKPRCPECRSSKTQKCGARITKKEGKKQRWLCTACATTFYPAKPRAAK